MKRIEDMSDAAYAAWRSKIIRRINWLAHVGFALSLLAVAVSASALWSEMMGG